MNRDADETVRDVRLATRLKFSTEATIMIAPEGLRCEATIGEPCGNDVLGLVGGEPGWRCASHEDVKQR